MDGFPPLSIKQLRVKAYQERLKKEQRRASAHPFASRRGERSIPPQYAALGPVRLEPRPRRATKYRCSGCDSCRALDDGSESADFLRHWAHLGPRQTDRALGGCPRARYAVYASVAHYLATSESLAMEMMFSTWPKRLMRLFNRRNLPAETPRALFAQLALRLDGTAILNGRQ